MQVKGSRLYLRCAHLTFTVPWVQSQVPHKPGLMVYTYNPTTEGVGGRRIRNSRSSLATQCLRGQPVLHETLSQKEGKGGGRGRLKPNKTLLLPWKKKKRCWSRNTRATLWQFLLYKKVYYCGSKRGKRNPAVTRKWWEKSERGWLLENMRRQVRVHCDWSICFQEGNSVGWDWWRQQ